MRTRSQPMSPSGYMSLDTSKQTKRKVSAPAKSSFPVKSNPHGARDSGDTTSNEKATKDTKRRSRKPSNKPKNKSDGVKEDKPQQSQDPNTDEVESGAVSASAEETATANNDLKRHASDELPESPSRSRRPRTGETGADDTNVTPKRPLRRNRITSSASSRNITPYAERMRRRKIEKEGRIDKTFFRIPQLVAQNEADRERQELATNGNRNTESEDYSSLKELQQLREEAKKVSLEQDHETPRKVTEGDEDEPRTPPSRANGESSPSRWQLKDLLTSVPRSISRMVKSPFKRSQTSGIKKSTKADGPQTPRIDDHKVAKTPPSQALKNIYSLSPAMSAYVDELSRKLPEVKNELEDEIVKQVSGGSFFATPAFDATDLLKAQPVGGSFSSATDTEEGQTGKSFSSHTEDPQSSSQETIADPPTPPAAESAVPTKRVRFDNSPMNTPSKLRQQNIPHSPKGSPSFVPNARGTFDIDQVEVDSEEDSGLHERSPSPQKKPPSPMKSPPKKQQTTDDEEPFIPNPHGTFDIDAMFVSSDEETEDDENSIKSPSSPKPKTTEISEATTPPTLTPETQAPEGISPQAAGPPSAASNVFAEVFSRSQDQKGEESSSRRNTISAPDSATTPTSEDGRQIEYSVAEEDTASGSELPSPSSPLFIAPPSPEVSTPNKQQSGFFGPRAPTPHANTFGAPSTPSTEMIKRLRDQAERHKPKTPSGLRVSRRSSVSPKDSPESNQDTSEMFPTVADSVPSNPFTGIIKEAEKKGINDTAPTSEGKAKSTLFNPFGASSLSNKGNVPSAPSPSIFAGLNNASGRETSPEDKNKPREAPPSFNPFSGIAPTTENSEIAGADQPSSTTKKALFDLSGAGSSSNHTSTETNKDGERESTSEEGTKKPLFNLSGTSSLFNKGDASSPNIFAGSNKETRRTLSSEETTQKPLFNLFDKPTENEGTSEGSSGLKKRATGKGQDESTSKEDDQSTFFNPFTAEPSTSNALVKFGNKSDESNASAATETEEAPRITEVSDEGWTEEGEEESDDTFLSAQLENLPDDLTKFQWPEWKKTNDLSSDPAMNLVKENWTDEDVEDASALADRYYQEIVAKRAEEATTASS